MFSLITLPYASLAPVISDQTLSFHHGKHLQGYVDNLNKLLPGSGLEDLPLEEIVRKASGGIFNNAGQILNHNLYFTQFKTPDQVRGEETVPHAGLDPASPLLLQIAKQWGSLEAFQAEFEAKGVSLFGSGWVWLAAKADGELQILQCPGADNPLCHFERSQDGAVETRASREMATDREAKSLRPILTFDVWEHAYYLDFQNRRAAHLHALWQILDWSILEERYNDVK